MAWGDAILRRELRNIGLRAAITLALLFLVWTWAEPSFADQIDYPIGFILLWWLAGQGGIRVVDGICGRFGWLPEHIERNHDPDADRAQ